MRNIQTAKYKTAWACGIFFFRMDPPPPPPPHYKKIKTNQHQKKLTKLKKILVEYLTKYAKNPLHNYIMIVIC